MLPPLLLLLNLTAAPVTLENASFRLGVDPATGALTTLLDRATGREYAGAPQPLYRLTFRQPELVLTSADAEGLTVRREGDAVVVDAPRHRQLDVAVTCRFALRAGSPLVAARLTVRSQPARTLAQVRFPVVSVGLPLGGDGTDDGLLVPYCDGYVVTQPHLNPTPRAVSYPGAASMQLLSLFDAHGGVYLAAEDHQAYTKSLVTARQGQSLALGLDHTLPLVPVTTWSLPYDVVMTSFAAAGRATTWEDAAELYRTWALRQDWCRQTWAARVKAGDVPRWLSEPSLWCAFSLRAKDASGQLANRLSTVVDHAQRWRQALDLPVTLMLMSWEKHGPWVAPDYFPPVGGAPAFSEVCHGLHAAGHRTMVFLSGLNWTLHKTVDGPPLDDQAAFDQRGRAAAIADEQGQPLLAGKADAGVGAYAQICAGTALATELLHDATTECQTLGIDVVQADQLVGGGQPLCYSANHGHAPGGGRWDATALRAAFGAARQAGRQRSADFVFSIEEPGEFFIPVLDTYHARDYAEVRWPRMGPGVVGVPLFTFVYHDYLPGYGGDSCPVSEDRSSGVLYQQALNLINGKTPSVAVWTRSLEPSRVDATQRRLLRSHGELWRGAGRDFLVFGRRLSTPVLSVADQDVSFWDPATKKNVPRRVPTVLHSRWQAPDGRVATVLVGIGQRSEAVSYDGRALLLEPGQAVVVP